MSYGCLAFLELKWTCPTQVFQSCWEDMRSVENIPRKKVYCGILLIEEVRRSSSPVVQFWGASEHLSHVLLAAFTTNLTSIISITQTPSGGDGMWWFHQKLLKLRGTSLEFSGNLTLKGAKEGPMARVSGTKIWWSEVFHPKNPRSSLDFFVEHVFSGEAVVFSFRFPLGIDLCTKKKCRFKGVFAPWISIKSELTVRTVDSYTLEDWHGTYKSPI